MNEDQLRGQWKQLKGKVQAQWGKLTNDDLDLIQGRRQELVGKIQERYGLSRAEAQPQYDEFLAAQSPPRRRAA